MKLDKSVRDFLRSGSKRFPIVIIILLATLMIFLGSLDIGKQSDKEVELEERIAEMCSLTDGVGDCRVMITYTPDGEVYAALVLCDGADSVLVRDKLTSMMCSLFGIGANRVEILKIKK